MARLQAMVRSQLVIAIEKQKQCHEEKLQLEQEKAKYQEFYDETFSKIKSDFDLEKEEQEKIFQENIKQLKNNFDSELNNREKLFYDLKEKYEKLELEVQKLDKEKSLIQKQYQESMRSYEIADERLVECRAKIKDLEEKLRNFEIIKEKNISLEKELFILQVKFESLIKEEALKREFLEKELKRDLKFESY